MNFNHFDLNQNILKALEENNYTKTTSIQEKVIPLILKGEDILAKSQTGSGKTASFVLPILNQFIEDEKVKIKKKAFISTIILTPTRDLTIQVAQTFELFSKHLDKKPKIVTVIGGLEIQQQLLDIQSGCDIVVATSGRLIDIIDKKQINLSFVKNFILDEADKMLDLGFVDELDSILKELPQQRQNLLFSATYPDKIMKIASKITSSALKVEIQKETPTVQDIEQRVIEVNKENRNPLLRFLLKTNKWNQVLVFMSNKRATDNVAAKFRKHGYLAESFHGDLDQEDRNYTLDEFKKKKIKILFCTDIASRGLHIDDISCVINFDLPRGTDSYIHRIGRTGRAGKKGEAITFIDHEDMQHFKLIKKRCNLDIKHEQIEGFELYGELKEKEKGTAPIKGKRKSKKDKLREELAKKKNDEI